MCNKVDLPEPEGPINPTHCPFFILKLILFNATIEPPGCLKTLFIFFNSSIVCIIILFFSY